MNLSQREMRPSVRHSLEKPINSVRFNLAARAVEADQVEAMCGPRQRNEGMRHFCSGKFCSQKLGLFVENIDVELALNDQCGRSARIGKQRGAGAVVRGVGGVGGS